MRKFLTLSLLLMLSVSAFARQHSVKGTVTIGYGSVRKQDLTTAVSVVSNEDMKLRPVSEASGFIQGKVAGVQVQQTSGLPGGGMTVRIRGASSIASSNDPLYVVDGVATLIFIGQNVGQGRSRRIQVFSHR